METSRFFRELSRNNRKEWMDENRERYNSAVVQPFRGLLEELIASGWVWWWERRWD